MTESVATAERPAGAPGRRLSPRVRRLLRDHDVDPADVTGTGRWGRITPHDVERRAGVHGSTRPTDRDGRGLASPLARRLLREAGLTLDDVRAAGPVTRRVAAAVIDGTHRQGATPAGTTTRDVDLTRVLHGVGAAHERVRRRTGIEITSLAPIAHALCRSLRRNPAFHAPQPDGAGSHRDVDLAVVLTSSQGPVTQVIPCAQDLTVPALAARVAAGHDDHAPVAPTFTIVGDGWGDTPSVAPGLLPDGTATLVVDRAAQRSVTAPDEFGGETTSTRWIATVHLTSDRADVGTAMRFLDDLTRELESVDLFAAVT